MLCVVAAVIRNILIRITVKNIVIEEFLRIAYLDYEAGYDKSGDGRRYLAKLTTIRFHTSNKETLIKFCEDTVMRN